MTSASERHPALTRQDVRLLAAMVVCSLVTQIGAMGSVLTAGIAASFSQASDAQVQMILQCSVVGSFAGPLAVAAIAPRVGAKARMVAGLALDLAAGLFPLACHDALWCLYASALLVGLGQSCVVATLGQLCLDRFDGRGRALALGANSAANNGGAALALWLAGQLAFSAGWVAAYWIYLLVLPALAVAVWALPTDRMPGQKEGEKGRRKEGEKGRAPAPRRGPAVALGPQAWALCALVAGSLLAYAAVPFNIGLYVARDAGLGASDSVGAAMALVTLAAALSSLALPWLTRRLGVFVAVLPPLCGLAGLVLLLGARSLAGIYVGAGCAGLFLGTLQSGLGYLVGEACAPAAYGRAYALATSMVALGQILYLPVMGRLDAWLNPGVPPTRWAFVAAAVLFGLLAVAGAAWALWVRGRRTLSERGGSPPTTPPARG